MAEGSRLPSARAAITHARDAAQLAGAFAQGRERLRAANLAHPQGIRACRALSELTDLVVQQLLFRALPEDAALREETRPKIAVIATGGYGRRELCPFSDIDVTFVVAEEEDEALDATVRRMFLSLMEVFSQRGGLKVGYGYRTVSDAAQLDHQTQTALLDARVVSGSHGLTNRFLVEVYRHIWPAAYVRTKVAERRRISEKHGATLYRIEPEVREGPGGLRDLHLAEWLAAVSFPSTRGDVWRQVQRLGVVTRQDLHDVTAARDFLLAVRTWMHWQTGRAADQLLRERQESLAEALGARDDDRASRVERFMELYYQHAETVDRVTGFVIDRCLSERLSITDEVVCSGSEMSPAYPWAHVSSPEFLMEMCRFHQELGLAPGYELRRMIAQHVRACPALTGDMEASGDFVALLRAQQDGGPGVHDTLRLLGDLGILQRLIPEFGEAYRRVPFDQIHRHTIGFHSLEAVKALEQLRSTEDEGLREFRRVWSEIDAPELLFLAALLHDVGKVAPGSGHADRGAEMARDICGRLRLDPPSMHKVETLVRHHLLMSETAQLRDLTLDKTIQDFTRVIDSPELLNMLLLLTYADMAATGVLSPMKIRFLEDLYFRAEPVVRGDALPAGDDARERRFRSRLSRQLSGANLTPEQVRGHTEGMPVSYLLNTPPQQIALHIRMVEALRNSGPVVEFDNEMGREVTTIHICTPERPEPGLLSQIAGVLYAHEIGVHGAQVTTRDAAGEEHPIALDTLWADFHGRAIPPFKRLELEQDLVSALKGTGVEQVIARSRKQLPPAIAPHRVRVDNTIADVHTVVDVEADDQPALLYRITRAMAALGWNIHSARISTRGDRARDAFYVTLPDGRKLDEDEARLVDAFMTEFAR